jgi:protein TonB
VDRINQTMHFALDMTSARPSEQGPEQRIHQSRTWAVSAGVLLAHAGLIWLIGIGLLSPEVLGGETEHLIMADVITDASPARTPVTPAVAAPTRPQPHAPIPGQHPPSVTPSPVITSAASSSSMPSTPAPTPTPAAAATPASAPAMASTATASKPQATAAAVTLPSSDADYLSNLPPVYPGMSRRMGEQGMVVLRVFISTEGRAEKAEIRSSSGYSRLDETALATVQRWRYLPGKRAGVPEAMWFNVPIRFALD